MPSNFYIPPGISDTKIRDALRAIDLALDSAGTGVASDTARVELGTGAPTPSPDQRGGDLFFDTVEDNLYVFNDATNVFELTSSAEDGLGVTVDLVNTSSNGNAFFEGSGNDKVYRADVRINGELITTDEHNQLRYDWTVAGTPVLSGIGEREYTITNAVVAGDIDQAQVDCTVICE